MKTILQNIRNEGKIKAGYISAFFLLLVSFLLTYYANRQYIKNAEAVTNTDEVIGSLVSMLSQVKDAEIGSRGYMLARDTAFLQPYFGSKRSTDSVYKSAFKLLSDNKEQLAKLETVKKKIDIKYNYIDYFIKYLNKYDGNLSEPFMDSLRQSRLIMDGIRLEINIMQATERNLLVQRSKTRKETNDLVNSMVIASIIVAFFLVVFGFFSHLKESKERVDAELKALAYQRELSTRVEELGKANEELIKMRSQEKLAATGRIARTIAHEIRNPLTNINLAAEQLSSELSPDDENTGFLFDMINRNSSRINMLITDLLQSTKFTDLNIKKESINELLEEALAQAQDRIKLYNVNVIKKYSDSICEVALDKDKMRIAFLNIIINAIEAMENIQDATLELTTKMSNDKCIVEIVDNGIGMDEEFLSKMFEPYFTGKKKGNGLGMTNTQNIILNHKGDLDVKSQKGKGTHFIITLNV